jgi:hypothetical protein
LRVSGQLHFVLLFYVVPLLLLHPNPRRFRRTVRGRLRDLGPFDAVHGLAMALARGRPERSESRDDDFLRENVGIGRFSDSFIFEPEDVQAGFVAAVR